MRSNHSPTATPGVGNTTIVAAGIKWDAVKVPRYAGLHALQRLGCPGAVAVDPASAPPVLYFLVPPRTTKEWDVPHTTALSLAAHVVLPPPRREAPPGPYWLIAPGRGRLCTDTNDLRRALLTAMGPRAEQRSSGKRSAA